MKQQYDALELTTHNRLTGDKKITTENLLNKDITHPVILMNENRVRIKEIKEEFEKIRNITEHLEEDHKKIKGIPVFNKVSYEKVVCFTLNY